MNKTVVENFFTAFNEGRLADLPRYMAADVVDHNQIAFGEADAFDGWRIQREAFTDGCMYIEDLVAERDQVVARMRVTGTHTGHHTRMPEPTGRRFEVEAIFILTVVDGKITEIRAVSDRLGLFMQAGWDWPVVA